ncbi:hypothetical protein Cgig2_008476 [Carnegiea gigantea]|uniref:Uncharacterized protein n=1 Tax=Carnegiea gigantea TaxID=171969 RepID=A0A9Q1JJP9_9CARY|nr:hypothetical protein Cgig2_008476 [Carnegiea gigantea]
MASVSLTPLWISASSKPPPFRYSGHQFLPESLSEPSTLRFVCRRVDSSTVRSLTLSHLVSSVADGCSLPVVLDGSGLSESPVTFGSIALSGGWLRRNLMIWLPTKNTMFASSSKDTGNVNAPMNIIVVDDDVNDIEEVAPTKTKKASLTLLWISASAVQRHDVSATKVSQSKPPPFWYSGHQFLPESLSQPSILHSFCSRVESSTVRSLTLSLLVSSVTGGCSLPAVLDGSGLSKSPVTFGSIALSGGWLQR